MDYDEFWNIKDEADVPPARKYDAAARGSGRRAYAVCCALWLAWMAYLTAWLVPCLAGVPEDGLVELMVSCGARPWMAWYVLGSLELFGLGAWAFMAAGLLRIACAAIIHATGSVPEPAEPPKAVGFLWTGIFALMTLTVAACSAGMLAAMGGLVQDDTGAGPLLFILTGPLAFISCAMACIGGFVVTMLSVPMFRFTARWVGTALNGARGRFV